MRIFSGTHKNQQISTVKGLETRPTSGKLRESLFNICQGYIQGAHFLDLFAGSGAMGLEALSRGAATATFIENEKNALKCIRKNITQMGFENRAVVITGDVFEMLERLEKLKKVYDIIYADPPYGGGLGQKVIEWVDRGHVLIPNGDLFAEDENEEAEEGLRSLILVSERKMGRASLKQYRKQIPSE